MYYRQLDAFIGSTVTEIDQCRKLEWSLTGLWTNWRANSSGWAKVMDNRKAFIFTFIIIEFVSHYCRISFVLYCYVSVGLGVSKTVDSQLWKMHDVSLVRETVLNVLAWVHARAWTVCVKMGLISLRTFWRILWVAWAMVIS
jgi:hypothetical protein